MSFLNRCKKLVPSVYKYGLLLEQTVVFLSVPKARCHNLYLSRQQPANFASCHSLNSGATCQKETKRSYSEVYNENNHSQKCAEELHELDSDNRDSFKRPSETFSLDVLVSLLRQENAVDICVIKVSEEIQYAQYFIVVSGVSPRHLRAMALYAIKVYKFLKKDGDPNVKLEGKDTEDWMCIDFGNVVVHFMLPETREVYELEKLWTLRSYDEQLKSIPAETLPEDFIYDGEVAK
ncbi:mitochondrial assembly of ribosomal large subunit protein 1 [Betta splendens]|uniref:Mitochondrial assembly of ribosomal large subunit protein 1 n=1 Tax=Betta splendens TaxID=158456 RepID=A0A6P7KYX7_BETSP|nr:mitochondrial assembly of ribosomal large subunit protein 1 [Betta splendens]